MPVVLGHARAMQAIHGGKANHATLDSQTRAVLRRGGLRPQAAADPAALRATRDRLRRRGPLTRQRAELRAHVQTTNRQDNRPAFRKQLAAKAPRDGVAERCLAPAGQPTGDVALARRDSDAQRLNDVELPSGQTAKQHEAQPLSRRHAVPGLGKLLRVGWRDERQDLTRVPRGQDVVGSCRRVHWAKAAAGKRHGPSGATGGPASRTWAFSAAAGLCRRHHPAGQKALARVERTPGKGKAWTVLAHTLARAVDARRKRDPVFERRQFRNGAWRGAGEPHAYLDAPGLRLTSGALRLSRRQRTRRRTEARWP